MTADPKLSLVCADVFRHAVERPNAEALVLGDVRWSYADFADHVRRLADALRASGIGKGDRVATLQTPHPEFLAIFLATSVVGAVWVGLNPRYRLGELLHIVRDCGPSLIFSRSRVGERAYTEEIAAMAAIDGVREIIIFDGDPAVAGTTAFHSFLARTGSDVASSPQPDDPCIIVYTSGSTGQPKGAVLRQSGLAYFARTQAHLWPVEPLRIVNYFPINHIGSVIDCALPALAAGGTIVFMEKFEPAACLRLMEAERISLWASVPSGFQLMLEADDFERFDLSAVQLIVWEGAAASPELIAQLSHVCPRMATNYGMTETTSAIAALPPTDDQALLASSVGPAFPGVEVRLVAADGSEVADGEVGEVQTRSPLLLLEYWRNPVATEAAFTPDGFFRTGDLAIRRPDGTYRVVGRLKEMFKSGGYNVYPREVEAALEAHPAISLAAVVGVPDPLWQEVGIAFVQTAVPITDELLRLHCRANLADYKIPKRIIVRDELPLLPIGKVDKVALKKEAEILVLAHMPRSNADHKVQTQH